MLQYHGSKKKTQKTKNTKTLSIPKYSVTSFIASSKEALPVLPPLSHFPFTLQPTSVWFLPPPFWWTLLFPKALRNIHQRWQFHPSTEHGTLYSPSFLLPPWSLLLNLLLRVLLPQTQPINVGDSPHSVLAQVSFPPYGILCILTKNTIHVCCPANRFIMNPGVSYCRQTLSYLSHNGRPPSFDIPYISTNIRYLFFSFWLTPHCI